MTDEKKDQLEQQTGSVNPNDPRQRNTPEDTNVNDPEDEAQDISKKAPGKDIDPNEEGSEEIERRRAS